MVELADPARVDQLGAGRSSGIGGIAQRLEPRARERSVDLDRREDEGADPAAARSAITPGGAAPVVSRSQPCTATVPPRASAETTTASPCSAASASTSAGSESAAVPRIARVGAGGEHRVHVARLAQPAADLHRDLTGELADALDVLDVDRGARAGAVEVDDVQCLRALVEPAPRRVERVGVVGRLAVVVALNETHRVAAADVDRRVEDQARRHPPLRAVPAEPAHRREVREQAQARGARLLGVKLDAVDRRRARSRRRTRVPCAAVPSTSPSRAGRGAKLWTK